VQAVALLALTVWLAALLHNFRLAMIRAYFLFLEVRAGLCQVESTAVNLALFGDMDGLGLRHRSPGIVGAVHSQLRIWSHTNIFKSNMDYQII
jgi:hypothetical protein